MDYEIKEYKRNAGRVFPSTYGLQSLTYAKETKLAPKELQAVHPLGKSPVVTIEDNAHTITLAESGAIVG